jgi:deazaflavin-dependent oxidoreductase (nitroreductase family)
MPELDTQIVNNTGKGQFFWWQRWIQRISAMRWASRFMAKRLHHWDRWVYRLTRGRTTATEMLTGLPVLFVTTIGARTGLSRTTPLLAIPENDHFILIATKFGADHHPDWYFNLKANPQVEVLYQGQTSMYVAKELEGQARAASWSRAVDTYPGYRAYEQRAIGRPIPVLALIPLNT